MTKTVAVYGGSFDPPHIAHVLTVDYVLAALPVERVLVVPTYAHALDKTAHCPFAHRMEMARLAMGHLRGVEVVPLEQQLPSPSRTLQTLEALQGTDPTSTFRLVLGSDILLEVDRWHGWPELVHRASPWIVPRSGVKELSAPPGCTALPLTLPEISSTQLREALGAVQPEEGGNLGRLDGLWGKIPHAVLDYIAQHRLYVQDDNEQPIR